MRPNLGWGNLDRPGSGMRDMQGRPIMTPHSGISSGGQERHNFTLLFDQKRLNVALMNTETSETNKGVATTSSSSL